MLGLLDTGAVVTIIGNNRHIDLEKQGFKLQQGQSLTVTAAGGQRMHSIGHMILPAKFEVQTFPNHLKSISFLKDVTSIASIDSAPSSCLQAYDHLSQSEKAIADNIIAQFNDISTENKGLGETKLVTHRIDTGDVLPNNALYRLTKNKHESGLLSEFSWKEVVPCELREQVINENHAEPTAGHLGIFKTYNRLALRYFWPGMHKDVVKFVSTCSKCLSYKAQNHQTLGEMGRPKQCSRPFQVISIDLMGPLPVTRKQNSYILVVTCCFSKFCLITPLRAATAVSVCKFLEDSVFLVHGIPQTVYLDNGSQFISKHTESLFERYKIPNIFFTPKYTPQINTVERYNRTIITCVSTYVDDDHRSWDIFLPKIQFAMNNSVSEATGFTPSFLVYGREIVTCGSHYVDNDLGDEILFLPRDIYAENLGCLSELFTNVQSKLWHAHIKNASHYNTRRKPLEFRVGDLVMKRTYVLSNKDKGLPSGLLPTELLPYGLRNIQKNISATHYTHDGGLSEVKTLPAVPAHY
ncbi:integrase core domain-containing protein [Phthorimaea operculella]|nr:integrase core domain-containing protein [Phthorimaea operculella]